MKFVLSQKYATPELEAMMMGPNPVKLAEELLQDNLISKNGTVCDLGSGRGLTSAFIAKEYGFVVYAADLWSEPEEHRDFFKNMGLSDEQIIPVKADATEGLPFDKEQLDAIVSVDSFHYFGSDPKLLDEKLLPYVKHGGYVYVAIPGMKKDCHDALPEELLLSWTPEALATMHDVGYWRNIVEQSHDSEVVCVSEMESNDELWADWLRQENGYAINDRKAMEAGGGKYFNFVKIILKKR